MAKRKVAIIAGRLLPVHEVWGLRDTLLRGLSIS